MATAAVIQKKISSRNSELFRKGYSVTVILSYVSVPVNRNPPSFLQSLKRF